MPISLVSLSTVLAPVVQTGNLTNDAVERAGHRDTEDAAVGDHLSDVPEVAVKDDALSGLTGLDILSGDGATGRYLRRERFDHAYDCTGSVGFSQ